MKHLKNYNLFESVSSKETLYIFDFDDTLVVSPKFEELTIPLLRESTTIESMLKTSLNHIKKSISDLKVENGRLYIEDSNMEISVSGNWVRKRSRVYLVAPDKFYYTNLSFPTKTKKLSEFYNSCKNKAIVTARIKTLQHKVEGCLDKLGLDRPNEGLFCYPYKDDRVGTWKAKTIVELIKRTGFKSVEYYDDKSKIVNTVVRIVKSELPDVNFIGHKVK